MLPILMYTMDPGPSSYNIYDDNVILNSVRNRKKVSELPNCPICSCTIRAGELESHLSIELERLQKLSNGGSKRKLSSSIVSVMPGSSTSSAVEDEPEIDVRGCPGADVYQRVHTNRVKRLRARRRSSPQPEQGECPICNTMQPAWKLQRHALRCLKRTGAELDEDVPDSSDDDIDVENDEPTTGFGAEYQWCGEWRVRATALQESDRRPGTTSIRRTSNDQALVVDGDEDIELYGPPQYSPSRIASDADASEEHVYTDEQTDNCTENKQTNGVETVEEKLTKANGLVEASAETRIQALKARIRDLEKKQNAGSEAKCLICLGTYTSPAVSIQCWHVYCEVCWLQSLKSKKICPQCNAITTTQHLRRIYM